LEGQLFHNRLTHVLKVAQIGRGLAERILAEPANRSKSEKLGGLDPDAVEAAALAHDLGHPPFGHVGERMLDELVKESGISDGFEGNAQSFRIVTKLAVRTDAEGLNLTRATLNALLKYPWLHAPTGPKSKKFGAYKLEKDDFDWTRDGFTDDRKSLEAELMDWADDVAYSVFDLEDFYKAGKIPLERLCSSDRAEAKNFLARTKLRWTQNGDLTDIDEYAEVFLKLISTLPVRDVYTGSRDDRATLRAITSGLIKRYFACVTLQESEALPRINIALNEKKEVVMLKELTWDYVITNSSLTCQQRGYKQVIKELFHIYKQAASKSVEWNIFPVAVRELLKADLENPARIVCDHIASLGEQQAIEIYRRFTGMSFGSALYPIV